VSGRVTVVPAQGALAETARALLELAGDTPEIVRTTRGGTEFTVPAPLAELYHRAVTGTPETAPKRRARSRTKED